MEIENDSEIGARAAKQFASRILTEQINKENIFTKAINNLKGKSPSDDAIKEIDSDWLTRFARYSEGVSAENMQNVWAAVLEREVVRPGSFSKRALTTLSDMGIEDADAFQRACLT